ncbi:MAG: ribose-5-phosphate isomerase RpiA [Pseudomonadales bacterium]
MDKQTQDALKKQVAANAIDYVMPRLKPTDILGIGTGSTANFFIDMLGEHRGKFAATVASSEASAQRLQAQGIEVRNLREVERIAIYVDGADEVNAKKEMIKGGGAALTREKIVAAASDEFVCIVDSSKQVEILGAYPLPIEVIPMAANLVVKELEKTGGKPVLREGVITDNGNLIIDLHGLKIENAPEMERSLNQITGVVTNGLFAVKPATVVLTA